MSSRWPSFLLNAANKQLTERVEQLTLDLDTKRNSVAEQRGVVALLKKHQHRAQQQVKITSEALGRERSVVENAESKLKQLQQEAEVAERRARQVKETETQLSLSVSALESTIEQRFRALSGERELAVELQASVKELVSAHLSRQRVGDELAAAQRQISSTVWTTLDRLNEQVHVSTRRLEDARGDHLHVLQEIDAMQGALQDALKDKLGSLRALELVHERTSQLDAQLQENAKTMEMGSETVHETEKLREELQATLKRLLEDNKHQSVARDSKRERYDKQVQALRKAAAALREEEARLLSTTRCEQAEGQQICHQHRQLDHIILLCEEKSQLLRQQQARRDALEEARVQMQRQDSTEKLSSVALRNMVLDLMREESLLGDRIERTRAKLADAIQSLMVEGRKSEEVNAAVGDRVKAKGALVSEQEASEGHVQILKQRVSKLDEALNERRMLLSSTQALTLEQRAQRQDSWLREVNELRGVLLRVQRDHQQLLHSTVALRSGLHHTRKTLEEKDASQAKMMKDLRLLGEEVPKLEREMMATVEERNVRLLQHEQAGVTLQSLKKAAGVQVSSLKEAAGLEAYLRAEVQIEEERIQADMQGALLELHLNEKEVRELNEEFQRHRKKLGLLRLRYEEVIGSITRAAQKPLKEEQGVVTPLLFPNSESAADKPETLHAHLLLRRSYEREQLMQRGNYLDLRLVTLDRETSTLRHMLEKLRSSRCITKEHVCLVDRLSSSTKEGDSSTTHERIVPRTPSSPLRSAEVAKSHLLDTAEAHRHTWAEELELLDEALAVMSRQRHDLRVRLHETRSTLKGLQDTERQRRMQLQKLRESVRRSLKSTSVVSVPCSK